MSTSPLTPDLKIRTCPGCGSFSRKRSIYSRFWKGRHSRWPAWIYFCSFATA
jgi:hypothetical protein